jgi:hypothetical protein
VGIVEKPKMFPGALEVGEYVCAEKRLDEVGTADRYAKDNGAVRAEWNSEAVVVVVFILDMKRRAVDETFSGVQENPVGAGRGRCEQI